ncbi:hypothetical protein PF010_g29899 [Phytophthora fragariae]|uniref:Uncharacterized protein n=1 Tax=Phytophthora fragariae TaxID=53985 RepID=A0A6G0JLX4_9STRA|nr:hypothetical protein PF010_g29899 [Phytophthora fragariae]
MVRYRALHDTCVGFEGQRAMFRVVVETTGRGHKLMTSLGNDRFT